MGIGWLVLALVVAAIIGGAILAYQAVYGGPELELVRPPKERQR